MTKIKFFPLIVFILSVVSCVVLPTKEKVYSSSGLVPEIHQIANPAKEPNKLCITNISGEKIVSIKLVFVEDEFYDEVVDTEPNWSNYKNRLNEPVPNKDYSYAELDPANNLKTLWVRIETLDRHCVFAIVYEMGCRIDVNIRKSDT